MRQILVRAITPAIIMAALGACGQRGNLYLPTDPAARGRATLPETLGLPSAPKSSASASALPSSQPSNTAP